jgi:hypothetical protein
LQEAEALLNPLSTWFQLEQLAIKHAGLAPLALLKGTFSLPPALLSLSKVKGCPSARVPRIDGNGSPEMLNRRCPMAEALVKLAKTPLQAMVQRLISSSRLQQLERLPVESLGMAEVGTQELDLEVLGVVMPQGSQDRLSIREALLLQERFNQKQRQRRLGKSSDALGQGLVTGEQLGNHGRRIAAAPTQFS